MKGIQALEHSEHYKISYFTDKEMGGHSLPERFTFPFYYTPHPLTVIAAHRLQHYLETQTDLEHNFGVGRDNGEMVIGKMFGVLLVKDREGRIGYLSGVSGKLAGSNDHPMFVPPVFDMLTENSFFLKEQRVIDDITIRIGTLENDAGYCTLKQQLADLTEQARQEIDAQRQQLKRNKECRDVRRQTHPNEAGLEAELVKQSLYDKRQLKALTESWEERLQDICLQIIPDGALIEALKHERKEMSAALQQRLFAEYTFLNKDGVTRSLQDIFVQTAFGKPPAGAGECATPKLLQYAFAHGYTPLAMAEFWWGASPKSEIRKHKQFYPACTGKCQPILAHMLDGMSIDDNPFLLLEETSCQLDIVFEDEHFIIVNKPSGLRSVPGVNIVESVYSRLKTRLKDTEPIIVHRLDMDTSGLLVVAKTPAVHKHLQKQFLNRTVKKRYTALLSRAIDGEEGEITLPLCADPFNRPRQLVDITNGKKSITRWKVVARTETTTRIHFWPLTGRTHQLRMHAAHELGLNAPIIGDDLYGTAAERLLLHAAYLSFIHPVTKERVEFEVGEAF